MTQPKRDGFTMKQSHLRICDKIYIVTYQKNSHLTDLTYIKTLRIN